MFDDLFGRFEGLDTEKLIEVVNLVWNNRVQIIDLVERLPDLLRDTGESIEAAGESAVQAALFLTGAKAGQPSARELSDLAADALDRCQQELASVAKVLDHLGDELDAVRIPSVRPKTVEILGREVVSGLDFGEQGLFDSAAGRLQGGAERLSGISESLETVAARLRDMGALLTDTGEDLGRVGAQLQSSGKTLRSLTDLGKREV